MECQVCGAQIDIDSRYCQKCGNEIAEFGISKRQLSRLLEEKIAIAKKSGIKQIYQDLINKLNQDGFEEIEIHKSSLEGVEFSGILETKGDKISIKNLDLVAATTLIMSYFINEFDAMHNEIGDIANSIHGDRVAYLCTAYQQYGRAIQSKNAESQRAELTYASNNCLKGINMLREEITGNLDFFEKLPKSTIKKLFCGIKLQDAERRLKLLQETFRLYCLGCILSLEIDLKNEETKKLVRTAHVERAFLNEMQKSKGYCRLLEVDDENKTKWDNKLKEMAVNMFFIEKYIESDEITMKILEVKQ